MYIRKSQDTRYKDKLNKLTKKRHSTYNTLRYKKLIHLIATKIIQKDTQILNKHDIDEISRALNEKTSYYRPDTIRRIMKTEIAKTDINNELMRLFAEKGINVTEKIVDHAEKASDKAKTTSDHLSCARFYRDLREIHTNSDIKEERTYTSFSDFKEDKPAIVKQTVQIKGKNEG